MGKKKGKQKGQYSSKARNAAYQFEVSQGVSDIHREWRRKRKEDTRSSRNIHESELEKLRREKSERGSVSLSLLRGILRERIIDDRERDASFRRHMMTNTGVKPRQCAKKATTRTIDLVGWMLTYNHREAIAGIDQEKEKAFDAILSGKNDANIGFCTTIKDCDNTITNSIPTLQSSCIHILSQYLQEYIDSCGEEYVHGRLTLLPSNTISALSMSCRDVTDQMAFVLGNHSHLDALVLCCSMSNDGCNEVYEKHDVEKYSNSYFMQRSSKHFTDTGLLSLSAIEHSYIGATTLNEQVTCSWEDQVYDNQCVFSHQKNLKRLELRNFQTESVHGFISFIENNPHITHLSLNRCFDAISGPQILLHDPHDCENQGSDKLDGSTILSILKSLQVLDLSGCTWVHFDLLHLFLLRIKHDPSYSSLEMIILNQCCSYLTKNGCEVLNKLMDRPLLYAYAP